MMILKVILAIVLPPAAALWQVGFTTHFWINLLLTLFGWFPGMVHALWLVLTGHQGHTEAFPEAPFAAARRESEREPAASRR
jgi:uncharacterized membrane protein YqaE (UPF0057 family)